MKVRSESEVAQSCQTLATPWTETHQAPPSMGFSRQEYWSGVPLPSPTDLLNTRHTPSLTTKLQFVNNISVKYNEVKHNEKIHAYILGIYKYRYVLIYIIYIYIYTYHIYIYIYLHLFFWQCLTSTLSNQTPSPVILILYMWNRADQRHMERLSRDQQLKRHPSHYIIFPSCMVPFLEVLNALCKY